LPDDKNGGSEKKGECGGDEDSSSTPILNPPDFFCRSSHPFLILSNPGHFLNPIPPWKSSPPSALRMPGQK
jgi:hypothetical protein